MPATDRIPTRRSSARQVPRRGTAPSVATRRGAAVRRDAHAPLGSYTNAQGRARELVTHAGHAGSVLVLDRDTATHGDRRLVAHLAADEPCENAALVCREYLGDPQGRWCGRVQREDFERSPLATVAEQHVKSARETGSSDQPNDTVALVDRQGNSYGLVLFAGERAIAQLRWSRRAPGGREHRRPVSLREVVASLESYEPARMLTEQAVARCEREADPLVSVARLRAELERMRVSPIVLNRRMREAVLEAARTSGLSMSEIARRCGMVKRAGRGRGMGETSWLARRMGIMSPGGEQPATPWVHSDVLALIARKGLGVSPREVEL
jgi:hypothetical protein